MTFYILICLKGNNYKKIMEYNNLKEPFTSQQKVESFLYLQNYILNKENKFFIGRLSGNESNLCGRILSNQKVNDRLLHEMLHTAGIKFSSTESLKSYVKQYHQACKHSDILAIWSGNMYSQAKSYYDLLEKLYPNKPRICAQALEPFYYMEDTNYYFDKLLENKKVLIISSHKKTIEQQLPKTTHIKPIFHNSSELYIYKPPQQNAGNSDGQPWTFHMDIMKKELRELKESIDFDIAFVSCGGFGMIICDYIYEELNSSVLYVGGGLQLYFGIMGNRWRQNPNIKPNDEWTDVLHEDKPPKLDPHLCELSCYW